MAAMDLRSITSDEDIVATALRILEEKIAYRVSLDAIESPQSARDYVKLRLAEQEREVFACMWLDNRHRVIQWDELFYGTIDGASVHPREVVKQALKVNAAAVILVHNHPSGVSEPSRADEQITHRLKDALALVDIRVLDHLIVGESVTSLAERGII